MDVVLGRPAINCVERINGVRNSVNRLRYIGKSKCETSVPSLHAVLGTERFLDTDGKVSLRGNKRVSVDRLRLRLGGECLVL